MDQNQRERKTDQKSNNNINDDHDEIKNENKLEEQGLPMKDSPYLQYQDLEDYKKKAYGTEGHLEPKPGRSAAASTDAPTLSGGSIASEAEALAKETAIKR